MKLEYEATLEDLSESQIRHYLHSRSFKQRRLIESGYAVFMANLMLAAFSYVAKMPFLWQGAIFASVIGFGAVFWTYKDTVSKRITKYLKREIGHRLPAATIFVAEQDRLTCLCLGSEVSFPLEKLSASIEHSRYLELQFGEAGMCTVPLRVFSDEQHKSAFLKAVQEKPLSTVMGD
jgi:hypothetical protein